MANPQLENGHVKVANELWDALTAYRLPGEQEQVLKVIIRKTYGWNKKKDAIALSQFVEMTGLKKPNVARAIKGLLSKVIISVIKSDNAPAHIYEINKDFTLWKPFLKKKSIIKSDNAPLSKVITTKDTNTKDNKHIPAFDTFWEEYPKKRSKGQAKKAWKKIKPSRELTEKIMAGLRRAEKSNDWAKDNGQFIPYPATWLNAEGWDDEPEVKIVRVKKNENTCPKCKKLIVAGECDCNMLSDKERSENLKRIKEITGGLL